MKEILRSMVAITLLGLLAKCNQDEVTSRAYPRLRTLPVTEITPQGATFSANIPFRGSFEIKDYGFIWSEKSSLSITNSERLIIDGNLQTNSFSFVVDNALRRASTYYVRSFLRTDDYIVYGEVVSFLSAGSKNPFIESFSPSTGILLDTLTILGENFSSISNQVTFNELDAEVISSTDRSIQVLVPSLLADEISGIRVNTKGMPSISQSTQRFVLLKPQIISLDNGTFRFGDKVNFVTQNIPIDLIPELTINSVSSEVFIMGQNSFYAYIPMTNDFGELDFQLNVGAFSLYEKINVVR